MASIFSFFALAFTHLNMSLKAFRSAPRLADSATSNSRRMVHPFFAALSRLARSWASME